MSHKLLITKGALLGILAAYLLVLVAFGGIAHLQHRQAGVAAANQRAIVYICSTTTVLDHLVVAASDQIDASFANGTYKKLEKSGILGEASIQAARNTLREYRKAHIKLTAASACRDVLARP